MVTATSRKERFEFRISRELLAEVETRAVQESVSRAEIVTRAIEAYLLTPWDLKNKITRLKSMLSKYS